MWNAHYDIFGKIDKLKINEVHNPIRMQGQYEDSETGLYYNRYRYYDPNISGYVSQDPLGLGAGENVYSYVKNSFGWIDPLGLSCKKSRTSTGNKTSHGNSKNSTSNTPVILMISFLPMEESISHIVFCLIINYDVIYYIFDF